MINNYQDYSLFLKFINTYKSECFKGIDRQDPLIMQLEEMTEVNNQYFFVADLLLGEIIFASSRSIQMIGVDHEELTPYHNIEAVHPEELYRNTNGWAKLLKMANDLIISKKAHSLLSVNMKMLNPQGTYSEILFQCKLFNKKTPKKKVCVLVVLTNIDSFKMKKHGYHYYIGNDMSYFRYPDKELLHMGNDLSNREFEIIRMIEQQMSSKQIAEKLFLSIYTVNTHRSNILKKTGKIQISDLIYDFRERGLL